MYILGCGGTLNIEFLESNNSLIVPFLLREIIQRSFPSKFGKNKGDRVTIFVLGLHVRSGDLVLLRRSIKMK